MLVSSFKNIIMTRKFINFRVLLLNEVVGDEGYEILGCGWGE